MAIAWAVLASSIFMVLVNTWYSRKLLGYGVLDQLRDQAGTLLLSGMAALAGWLVLHWMRAGTLAMLSAIAAAVVVYLSGAVIGRHPALRELFELARTLRPPRAQAPKIKGGPGA
jgi:hypothetical protein